jgi:hypothetical protein
MTLLIDYLDITLYIYTLVILSKLEELPSVHTTSLSPNNLFLIGTTEAANNFVDLLLDITLYTLVTWKLL